VISAGDLDTLRPMIDIERNLADVSARIALAAGRAGRPAHDITLVAVTKTQAVDRIDTAWTAGLRDFGENRVQEAKAKIDALRGSGRAARWHLVGHLQRNKVPAAIGLFDILHTVDSERLAEAISAHAKVPVRVLIEVNVAGEVSKFGVAPPDVLKLAERVGRLPGLDLAGLMTVAPQADHPDDVRPVFRTLRQLGDAAGLHELSMGMTDDFEVAVEEGSTLVRVGRAIFGAREADGGAQ
jgi:pyridoxal phosphate enzyme (YggS family)